MPSTKFITYQLSFMMDRSRQWQIETKPTAICIFVTQLKRVTDRKSASADRITRERRG